MYNLKFDKWQLRQFFRILYVFYSPKVNINDNLLKPLGAVRGKLDSACFPTLFFFLLYTWKYSNYANLSIDNFVRIAGFENDSIMQENQACDASNLPNITSKRICSFITKSFNEHQKFHTWNSLASAVSAKRIQTITHDYPIAVFF